MLRRCGVSSTILNEDSDSGFGQMSRIYSDVIIYIIKTSVFTVCNSYTTF